MTLAGVVGACASAQAATISLNGFSNTDHGSTGTMNGTVSGDGVDGDASAGSTGSTVFAVSNDIRNGDSSPQTLEYTVSGLNIDGVGGFNDSFVIQFTVTTDGQNFNVLQDSSDLPKNAGWLSSGETSLNANGEYVQFQFAAMTVNLNGGTNNGTGAWLGFTSASVGSWGSNDVATFNGISRAYNSDDSKVFDLTAGGNDNSLIADFDTAANTEGTLDAAGAWRPEAWSFQVEVNAVPEPSSTALIGLGGFALILRRRK